MKVLKFSLLCVALVVLGFYFHSEFFEYSLSLIDTKGVQLHNRTISGIFNRSLILPIILGSIPLFYLLVQKITKFSFVYKGLITIAIIIFTGIIFWRLRVYGLNAQFRELSGYKLSEGLKQQFDVSILKFEIYLLMGFIVGTLIAILIFRDKNEPLLN